MEDQINELLTRGVDKIYPSKDELESVLRSGKKIKLYQGFDPTGTKLHLGHMVGLRKHRQWQDLGHEVIFLIGDGTGQAGDPSGKKKTREKFFTQEELRENAKEYLTQAGKVVRFDGENPIKILYNGDWLNKLNLVDILNIAQHFSVQQLIERDMFQDRLKAGESINLREFLYPLLQGYDSVAMEVDLELGGSDQTFNMLTGRTLMKAMKGKEKFVMTTPLLADSKGVKIGKTEGNVMGLTDEPNDLFGKIMSLPDEVIAQCFECITTIPLEEVSKVKKALEGGENPMVYKKKLAHQIVMELNDKSAADAAEESWSNTFQKGEIPEEMTEIKKNGSLMESLVEGEVVSSKGDFRRLVEEGAVTNLDSGEKITEPNYEPQSGERFKIGKKRFVKVI
jgi:tyrosyl-tRNA synthetase